MLRPLRRLSSGERPILRQPPSRRDDRPHQDQRPLLRQSLGRASPHDIRHRPDLQRRPLLRRRGRASAIHPLRLRVVAAGRPPDLRPPRADLRLGKEAVLSLPRLRLRGATCNCGRLYTHRLCYRIWYVIGFEHNYVQYTSISRSV